MRDWIKSGGTMGSKWRKVRLALGLNTCLYAPLTSEDSSPSSNTASAFSNAGSDGLLPTSSSSDLRLSKVGIGSSKKICAICLTTLTPRQGQAIFTAECSHSFHFHCITSNVKHGSQICPICRAKWREVPFKSNSFDLSQVSPRIDRLGWRGDNNHNNSWMTLLRRVPSPRPNATSQILPPLHVPEPHIYDDDDVLDHSPQIVETNASLGNTSENCSVRIIEMKTSPEISAVHRLESHENFSVLVHITARHNSERQNSSANGSRPHQIFQNFRAPVDLVTVLDVSGSMSGTKLALLKQAMGFLIQNLGPADRLSVVSFSSTANRLFPLRRMSDVGKNQALQAVNSLISKGGTNIAEGLRKGGKVLVDRTWRNPVGNIILLSDGQDTYAVRSPCARSSTDYHCLLKAIYFNNGAESRIPVHSFGFGTDHDAASMHSISEISGGTFSFIEGEDAIQDAFAQCIGGLLSVVAQKVQVEIDCVHPSLQIGSIKSGSYRSTIEASSRSGSVNFGDLYAEEEKDFLVTVNIPVDESCDEMSLLEIRCVYRDPITKETVTIDKASEVKIERGDAAGKPLRSLEVDRQRNRLRAIEAMASARALAEHGNLGQAVDVLESCRKALSETISARAGDRLCIGLCAELKEMQERMENRRIYETSGRAYVLSGLSSHSWQRATTRGDCTGSGSAVQSYQTPTMIDMVTMSQTISKNQSPQKTLRSTRSFPCRTKSQALDKRL